MSHYHISDELAKDSQTVIFVIVKPLAHSQLKALTAEYDMLRTRRTLQVVAEPPVNTGTYKHQCFYSS